ncbi:phage holin family protein [Verrucomicrobiaceae bacterium 227]
MAFGRQNPTPSGAEPGLKEELSSFTNGVKSYVGARAELLAIEAKEAAGILGRKAGLGGLAAFFLLFGYLLLLVFGIGLIGQLLSPDVSVDLRGWVGATLILAGFHILVGIISLVAQKRTKIGPELFEVTRAELKKDQEWLNNGKEN